MRCAFTLLYVLEPSRIVYFIYDTYREDLVEMGESTRLSCTPSPLGKDSHYNRTRPPFLIYMRFNSISVLGGLAAWQAICSTATDTGWLHLKMKRFYSGSGT